VAEELGVHLTTLYRWAAAHPDARPQGGRSATAERLIDAAGMLLRERDYAQLTVEQVAASSGVALRTAFHHFATKRELFNAVVDRAAQRLVEDMTVHLEALDAISDPVARLEAFLKMAAETAYARPEVHVMFRDLGIPPVESFATRWHRRFEEVLGELLGEVAAARRLDPRFDPAGAGRIMARTVRGIHASVFEGASPAQATVFLTRLYLLVLPLELAA
jgi:AcrR family transcriptional regulator